MGERQENWVLSWWQSMKATIVLICLAPIAALILTHGPNKQSILLSQLLTILALLIGFCIDQIRRLRKKSKKKRND